MNNLFEKIKERVKNIIPLDNDAFSYFANDKMFCQEFLRAVLEDDKLEVIENHIQDFIPNIYFKTAILDMLCMLSDGRVVNVEIQLYKDEAHAKRIFQYVSMIKQIILEKGEKYKNVSDIIVIYLTKEDIFKKGSTVYNVDMKVVSDKDEVIEKWEPGLVVKYVNTEGLTNKKINEYLQLLKDKTTLHKEYKEVSRIKKDAFESGGVTMSKWFYDLMEEEKRKGMQQGMQEGIQQGRQEGIQQGIQEGIQQGRQEGIQQGTQNILNRLVEQGLLSKEEAEKQLEMA